VRVRVAIGAKAPRISAGCRRRRYSAPACRCCGITDLPVHLLKD
jgi:hypothetical protein